MQSRSVDPQRDLPEVPYFTLDMHERPDTDVVEVLLTGDLDSLTVGHLEDSLVWVVERMPQRHVVVDVAGLVRLESAGVDTLVRFRGRLAEDRRTLGVTGATSRVRGLLRLAGLLDPVRPDPLTWTVG